MYVLRCLACISLDFLMCMSLGFVVCISLGISFGVLVCISLGISLGVECVFPCVCREHKKQQWVAKIADFGLGATRSALDVRSGVITPFWTVPLSTAP